MSTSNHHVCNLVQRGDVEIVKCRTEDMLADILTTSLPKDKFFKAKNKLEEICWVLTHA